MKYITILFFLVLLFIFQIESSSAQERRRPRGGLIYGMVVDAKNEAPIEYAYLILYKQKDSTQVAGTVSNEDGQFSLMPIPPGQYYLEVQYMGYDTEFINELTIARVRGKERINLGRIELKQSTLSTTGIIVEAEREPVTYKIDKKVINVDQIYTAVSGNAVDVLENIPSVTVDIDGNVQLRGSSSFMVLIDNRPSILEANEILQQIPASTIENIEIITNPSAKFDPDGTSGIINIITKKDKRRGVNGIVNLNGGLNNKYGGDFLLSYRMEDVNFHIGADYNKRFSPGNSETEKETVFHDTTSFVNSEGSSERERESYGFRGGLDYSITQKDLLSLEARYGYRSHKMKSDEDYKEWTVPGSLDNTYMSQDERERSGPYYSVNLDYLRKFKKEGHQIQAQANFRRREGDELTTNFLLHPDGTINAGQQSVEKGPGQRLRFKLDYTLLFNEDDKFEAGLQSRLGKSEDITEMREYDSSSNNFIPNPKYSHAVEYRRDIHSLYSIYGGSSSALGYQFGVRAEYTYRYITLIDEAENFTIDRWDFFPTAHLSYQFNKGQQAMASYTRRIERPRGWNLEPFLTWMDAYNVRQGNPDLQPEFIDSYELGAQTHIGDQIISAELYYRVTHNKIERVRSVYSPNVTLRTIENVGTDYTFGSELMLNLDLFKWWKINLMGDLSQYKVEGVLFDNPFSRESFNGRMRVNQDFRFFKNSRIQLNTMYNSATVSSQGEREGYFMVNLGIRQEFLERSLSATLQVRDLFATAKYKSISEGPDFIINSHRTREAPVVMLSLSYTFNDYQKKQKQRENNRQGEEDDDDF